MKKLNFLEASEKAELKDTLKQIANPDSAIASEASRKFTKAVEVPIRKTILSGDIITGIFTPDDYTDNPDVRYPLDLISPGQEAEFYAYTMPDHGMIPQRKVESDYLRIETYRVANSIDCNLNYLRDANWNVVGRMLEILEAGFVKKMNDDGWQTIIAAGLDRNIIVNDADANAGQFTPRLITFMKSIMRRNGGGNSTSLNRARLTDLYVSPEAKDDIRSWGLDLIPDSARTNIFNSSDDGSLRVFDVNIHDFDELGVSQEYQLYYTSTLGGTLAAADVELVVGLDLQRDDSFVMPVRENVTLFDDPALHRRSEFGMYGWGEFGIGVLDSRRVLLGSF